MQAQLILLNDPVLAGGLDRCRELLETAEVLCGVMLPGHPKDRMAKHRKREAR